jgi:hypothetical protein
MTLAELATCFDDKQSYTKEQILNIISDAGSGEYIYIPVKFRIEERNAIIRFTHAESTDSLQQLAVKFNVSISSLKAIIYA